MRQKLDREAAVAELVPGAPIELLKDLHLLTRDGELNADARRKAKQIRHLLQLLGPALDDVYARHGDPVIVDCGAGKSYLGFLLYAHRLAREAAGRLIAVESRPELVAGARERATRFGHARMSTIEGTIAGAELPERLHLVTALHAACPHAGCFVDYRGDHKDFFCPCHNSAFSHDGAIINPSPSARGLDTLDVAIHDDGGVWVKFQDFKAGVKQKLPVA